MASSCCGTFWFRNITFNRATFNQATLSSLCVMECGEYGLQESTSGRESNNRPSSSHKHCCHMAPPLVTVILLSPPHLPPALSSLQPLPSDDSSCETLKAACHWVINLNHWNWEIDSVHTNVHCVIDLNHWNWEIDSVHTNVHWVVSLNHWYWEIDSVHGKVIWGIMWNKTGRCVLFRVSGTVIVWHWQIQLCRFKRLSFSVCSEQLMCQFYEIWIWYIWLQPLPIIYSHLLLIESWRHDDDQCNCKARHIRFSLFAMFTVNPSKASAILGQLIYKPLDHFDCNRELMQGKQMNCGDNLCKKYSWFSFHAYQLPYFSYNFYCCIIYRSILPK